MRPRTRLPLLVVALMALTTLLIAAACGGSDTAGTTAVRADQTDARDSSPAADEDAPPASGRILVSSSVITGQEGKLLIVFGPASTSQVCAMIDSDRWSLSEAPLTDRSPNSDPCVGERGVTDSLFEPGEHFLTASLVVPGDSSTGSAAPTAVTVVDGDVSIKIDGSKLTNAVPAGDHGRILVTSSEITGQKGKMLVVLAQGNAGSACALIDTDPWSLPTPTAMTELSGADGGPCGDGTPEVSFSSGDNVVTASIFVPDETGSQASTQVLVTVDGDVTAALDGTPLSAP